MRRLGIIGTIALALTVLLAGCGGSGGPESKGDVETASLAVKAGRITELIVKNDWGEVRKDFDSRMKDSLSEDGLAEAWRSTVDQVGGYQRRGNTVQADKPGDLVVMDTPMMFERGERKSRVSFHPDGKIAGLFLLEPSVP